MFYKPIDGRGSVFSLSDAISRPWPDLGPGAYPKGTFIPDYPDSGFAPGGGP